MIKKKTERIVDVRYFSPSDLCIDSAGIAVLILAMQEVGGRLSAGSFS